MIAEDGHVDEDGDGGGPEPDGDDGKAEDGPSCRGPPARHVGSSHKNKADRTVVLRVYRCGTCGRGHLRKLPPVVNLVYDFAGGNSTAVEYIAYVMRRGSCKRCGGMITTATAPAIPGMSFGPGILGFIEEYYAGRCTGQTISFFDALYGFAISQNAVWNARKAIRDLLEVTYGEIPDHITEAPFVQLDESPVRMNGRQGYV